jgi:hypothetical protein
MFRYLQEISVAGAGTARSSRVSARSSSLMRLQGSMAAAYLLAAHAYRGTAWRSAERICRYSRLNDERLVVCQAARGLGKNLPMSATDDNASSPMPTVMRGPLGTLRPAARWDHAPQRARDAAREPVARLSGAPSVVGDAFGVGEFGYAERSAFAPHAAVLVTAYLRLGEGVAAWPGWGAWS